MSPGINPDGDKLLLGRGKVYFDRVTAAGVSQGERYLGDCAQFSVTGSPETKDRFSSSDKTSGLLKRAVIRQTWEFEIEMAEYDAHNVALALLGATAAVVQSSGTVTDAAIANGAGGVVMDRWYKFAGRDVTGIIAKKGASTLTLNTDYAADAVNGRLLFITGGPGGVVAGDTTLTVTFTKAAKTYTKVTAGTDPIIEGRLVFIGDNVVGENYHFEAWKVQVAPDGALALIGDDWGVPKLKGTVLADAAGHPTSPYFDATKVVATA